MAGYCLLGSGGSPDAWVLLRKPDLEGFVTSPATTAREKAEKIAADIIERWVNDDESLYGALEEAITAALLAEREAGKAEGRAEAIAELAGAGRNHAADALAGDKA